MGPKSAAGTHRIKHLLELARELGQPLTIMVFKGGMVTLLGLLQELHLCLSLTHPNPHTRGGEEGAEKQGVLLPDMHFCHQKGLHIPQSHHNRPLLEQLFLWEMPGVCSILWAADEETLPKVSWPQGGMQESMLQGQ